MHYLRTFLFLLIFGGVLAPVSQAKFADIDTTHPYFHAIDSLQDNQIVEGYEIDGDRFFRSLQKISRAEALKILLLSADINLEKDQTSFPDSPKNSWFSRYVATAKQKNFVKGFKDGNFHPQAQVSRAEFLKMASLAFNIPLSEYENAENVTKWYEPYFNFSAQFRITDPSSTDPYETITRGEIAETIYRLQHVATKDFSTPYLYSGNGSASFYNEGFAGKSTANGEIYDPMDMTAAHRTLPFGTKLRVWTDDRQAAVIIRINDRGPYHSQRIIDLSEKAFSLLAPISRGVIEVNFEVFYENNERPEIPEDILPDISAESQNIVIPDEVKTSLQSETPIAEAKRTTYLRKQVTPVFKSPLTSLAKDFFPTLVLRSPFPQKILTGTILSLEGIATDSRHQEVTIFLQPLEKIRGKVAEQITFSGPVSSRNFSIPLHFSTPGKYQMGVVFDDDRQSRVTEIEVSSAGQNIRHFGESTNDFLDDFTVNVVPENREIILSWQNLPRLGQLNKFVFGANDTNTAQTILVEGEQTQITLPYDFFEKFSATTSRDFSLAVDRFAAESEAGTINTQTTNWKKLAYKNFVLVPGFRDTESDQVSIKSFIRFPKSLGPMILDGKLLSTKNKLAEHAYFTTPNGKITKIPVIMQGLDQFKLRLMPADWGTHTLEIVSTTGEILFNRGIYFSRNVILPVQGWDRIKSTGNSTISIKNWLNRWRQRKALSSLNTDTNLSTEAQKYAEKMATEDFIGHTSPTGVTFEDRIKQAHLTGEFAENLSFGTDLDIALDGLQDSASHFSQIVNPRWSRVGIGLAQNDKGFYVVQIFGR